MGLLEMLVVSQRLKTTLLSFIAPAAHIIHACVMFFKAMVTMLYRDPIYMIGSNHEQNDQQPASIRMMKSNYQMGLYEIFN